MVYYYERATLRFDGSCRPNPGRGGCAYVLIDDYTNEKIDHGFQYLSWRTTNNEAEYLGLLDGLEITNGEYYQFGHLSIEGDSKLVINQLKGIYRVRNHSLKILHQDATQAIARGLGKNFDSYSIEWIDRCYNEEADELANHARVSGCCC